MFIDKNELNYIRALFFSIVMMLLPFTIVNLTGKKALLLPLLATSFIILVVVVLHASFRLNHDIRLEYIMMSLIYLYILSLTVISNIFMEINIELFDLINVFAKAITLFLFFSLPKNINLKKETLFKFYQYMIILGIVACIYNMIVNFNSILHFFSINSSYELSLKSFFSNRNQFGSFLFIELTLIEAYKNKSKNVNIFLYFCSALFLVNLVLTMSRGAILATAVFFIYVFLNQRGKLLLKVLSLALFIYGTTMVLMSNNSLFMFIRNMIIRPESGTTGRSGIWLIGLSVLAENNFIVGLGLNTALRIAKTKGLLLEQFHSFYIELLLNGGILELLFTAVVIISVIKYLAVNNAAKVDKNIIYARLLGFLSLGVFESVSLFSIGYVDVFFSIFIITLPILISNSGKSEKSEFN